MPMQAHPPKIVLKTRVRMLHCIGVVLPVSMSIVFRQRSALHEIHLGLFVAEGVCRVNRSSQRNGMVTCEAEQTCVSTDTGAQPLDANGRPGQC